MMPPCLVILPSGVAACPRANTQITPPFSPTDRYMLPLTWQRTWPSHAAAAAPAAHACRVSVAGALAGLPPRPPLPADNDDDGEEGEDEDYFRENPALMAAGPPGTTPPPPRQGRLLLVGSHPSLGAWDWRKGLPFTPVQQPAEDDGGSGGWSPPAGSPSPAVRQQEQERSPSRRPRSGGPSPARRGEEGGEAAAAGAPRGEWELRLELPVGAVVEAKLVWVDAVVDALPVWEAGDNRVLVVSVALFRFFRFDSCLRKVRRSCPQRGCLPRRAAQSNPARPAMSLRWRPPTHHTSYARRHTSPRDSAGDAGAAPVPKRTTPALPRRVGTPQATTSSTISPALPSPPPTSAPTPTPPPSPSPAAPATSPAWWPGANGGARANGAAAAAGRAQVAAGGGGVPPPPETPHHRSGTPAPLSQPTFKVDLDAGAALRAARMAALTFGGKKPQQPNAAGSSVAPVAPAAPRASAPALSTAGPHGPFCFRRLGWPHCRWPDDEGRGACAFRRCRRCADGEAESRGASHGRCGRSQGRRQGGGNGGDGGGAQQGG